MEDKEAIVILTKLLHSGKLENEEEEALRTGLGLLSWTKLIEGRVKTRKARLEKKLDEDEHYA